MLGAECTRVPIAVRVQKKKRGAGGVRRANRVVRENAASAGIGGEKKSCVERRNVSFLCVCASCF